MTPTRRVTACALVLLSATSGRAAFTTFESGQVRPLALSPDGTRLFAVNTPGNHLEIFAVDGSGDLSKSGSVPVGLEPVAVAARTNGEVWVVNHLSDSVSIVDVATSPPRVVRTLLVGDEPRDVVFAGTGGSRAFITTAHRGQNRGSDPQLTTPGIGRADVWVFDVTNLGASLGGTPLSILTLFCDTPRALAVSPDGATVYAAAFHSGNQTTALNEGIVCNGGAGAPSCNVGGTTYPGGLPAPNTNFQGFSQPEVGLIVRFDQASGEWRDELARNWTPAVRFDLPDQDVFAIDANDLAAPPTPFAHVGTVLFNMAVNPLSGKLYVSNTEARNEKRFEGPGTFAGHTVRGHLHEARISVVSGTTVTPRHLNKHIDYAVVPSPAGVKQNSLAIPTGMAVTGDGATLYVAAFGSSKVGIFDVAELENDTFTPSASDHITVTGGGPSGLVLNEAKDRLYVFTRFDNAVSVVDTATAVQIDHIPVHNPEPAIVVNGRPILYDAVLSSSNGEASCASCHVFGDFDSLAWDLGNPDDTALNNPNPFEFGGSASFAPLKGPMTTQSLRGMANHGPMHWRGDRTGGNDPGGSALDEDAAFKKFIIAFDGLLGLGGSITNPQMQAFTDFILQVTYPPNPVRALDNSLTTAEQAGRNLFFGPITDVISDCNGCHVLDPSLGFFGSDGEMSFEGETQDFKIPHLRNVYQKIGMFGMPAAPFVKFGDNDHKGDQVRGFGFLHDGSIDTLFRFHSAAVFSTSETDNRNLEAFMLAFDSNLAPIVGQQITLTSTNAATVGPRINLMIVRAAAGECELTVKGTLGAEQRGWFRTANGSFISDRGSEAALTDAQLRAHATTAGQERTYLCVPPGSGFRIGIDRDDDGFGDRDELDAGTDPTDPLSTPGGPTTTSTSTTSSTTTTTFPGQATMIPAKKLTLKDRSTAPADPSKRRFSFRAATKNAPPFNRVESPAPGSLADPTVADAFVVVYASGGVSFDLAFEFLNASGWVRKGTSTYVYTAASSAAITKVVVKPDSVSIKGGKSLFNYSLDEPAQLRVAVQLKLGASTGGRLYCAEAPAKQSGKPPTTMKNDRIDKFVGQPNALASFCP